MSTARANVQAAKSSKEDQNKAVAKANEVVGALLAPGRHVASLLSGLGALFPPCKQVGNSLAVRISSWPLDPTISHNLPSTRTGANQA
jgi:hypothetical protein